MALEFCSGYMREVYSDTDLLVSNARRALENVDYDTMAGTGLSGSLVIPVLARALGKHWLLVRKPNDGTHSHLPAEGTLGDRWVFVDDFISSGTTLRRVQGVVKKLLKSYEADSVYVGNYLYQFDGGFCGP